jgi:hypothetical protein
MESEFQSYCQIKNFLLITGHRGDRFSLDRRSLGSDRKDRKETAWQPRNERRSFNVRAFLSPIARKDITMVEILLMAQLAQRPLQAIARRWYCRSLFRATRGRRGCAGTTA